MDNLSPWPVRLLVFALLVAAAIAAIHLIDERAMSLQRQFDQQQALAAAPRQAMRQAGGKRANPRNNR